MAGCTYTVRNPAARAESARNAASLSESVADVIRRALERYVREHPTD